jgi:hypothetical protein
MAAYSGVRIGIRDSDPVENNTNWDLSSSFFLALQIMGSVGYGNSPPRTSGGRVFCVFFALVGIPLFIIASFGVGELISGWIESARCSIYRRLLRRSPPHPHSPRAVICNTLGLFAIGMILFVLIPAAIFTALEPAWTFGDAMFSVLMTTLTIGFYDFQPGETAPKSYNKPYRVLVGLWIMLDLYWFAGVLQTMKVGLKFSSQVQMTFDQAIYEEQTTDVNGNKKIHIGKNWKRKLFDKQWTNTTTDIATISRNDISPVYSRNRLYPLLISHAVDSRLTSYNPTGQSSEIPSTNISRVNITKY